MNAPMIAIFGRPPGSQGSTLDRIATPCSVKANSGELAPPRASVGGELEHEVGREAVTACVSPPG